MWAWDEALLMLFIVFLFSALPEGSTCTLLADDRRTIAKRRKKQRRKLNKALQEHAGQCQGQQPLISCLKGAGRKKDASVHVHFADQTEMPIKSGGMVKNKINKGVELMAGKKQKGSGQFVEVKGQRQTSTSGLMANNNLNVNVQPIGVKRKASGKKKTDKKQKASGQFVEVKGQRQTSTSGLMANNNPNVVNVPPIGVKRKGSGKKKTDQAGPLKGRLHQQVLAN